MVSARSEANVMVKNMIDVGLGGTVYWFVGFGFSFGPNSKGSSGMSGEGYFITDVDLDADDAYIYIKYFFQLSFAATATTIVSGECRDNIGLRPPLTSVNLSSSYLSILISIYLSIPIYFY